MVTPLIVCMTEVRLALDNANSVTLNTVSCLRALSSSLRINWPAVPDVKKNKGDRLCSARSFGRSMQNFERDARWPFG